MTDPIQHLVEWLRQRPEVLEEVVRRLRIPVPKCEGPHDCDAPVLWKTGSQTRYTWNGEGEDPNASKNLCRHCSEEYTEIMDSQWADYHSGLL